MAGKVRNIDLAVDKDGNSRGFAVIEYDHPVEAVQVSFIPFILFIPFFVYHCYYLKTNRNIYYTILKVFS